MATPRPFTRLGSKIQMLAEPEHLDFLDCQTVDLPRRITPLEAWRLVMSRPMPVLKLGFAVRDRISAHFGVKKIGGFSGVVPDQVDQGQKLDFFRVDYVTDDVLTLTERDRHLDVMTCISTDQNRLSITSSVITHNLFGRLYMIPVAPAHKLIVYQNLQRIRRQVHRA